MVRLTGSTHAPLLSLLVAIAFLASPAVTHAQSSGGGLSPGSTAVVSGTEGQGLRVRGGPSVTYRILAVLPDGARVRIVSGPLSDGAGEWYQVSTGGDLVGWAVARYLSVNGAAGAGATGLRTFVAKMTAYADGVNGIPMNARTATGTSTRWGVVAVDPRFIRLGSTLAIEGYPGVVFTAEDTGGAIRGATIDIWLPDPDQARRYGTQYRKVTVLREGPAR